MDRQIYPILLGICDTAQGSAGSPFVTLYPPCSGLAGYLDLKPSWEANGLTTRASEHSGGHTAP